MKEKPSKYIIIGSVAMKYHYPEFRDPHDCDIIIRKRDYQKILLDANDIWEAKTSERGDSAIVKYKDIEYPFEFLFADGVKSLELILDQLTDDTISEYADPQILYSLKKAHIHYPIKFDKHIKDFMFLRAKLRTQKGITRNTDLSSIDDLLDGFPGLTYIHAKETEERLGKLKTPKMNQDTKKFFGKSKNFVKSYFVHDNMHLAISHEQSDPIYLRILKEGSEVETDVNLWMNLTVQQRIWCVMEEVYVIALERKILPQLFENIEPKYDEKSAFDWALYRVCTTLCDGFFREFAVRAYDEIQKQYDPNYVKTLFNNIYKYEQKKEK